MRGSQQRPLDGQCEGIDIRELVGQDRYRDRIGTDDSVLSASGEPTAGLVPIKVHPEGRGSPHQGASRRAGVTPGAVLLRGVRLSTLSSSP